MLILVMPAEEAVVASDGLVVESGIVSDGLDRGCKYCIQANVMNEIIMFTNLLFNKSVVLIYFLEE